MGWERERHTSGNVIDVKATISSPTHMASVLEVAWALRLACVDILNIDEELARDFSVGDKLVATEREPLEVVAGLLEAGTSGATERNVHLTKILLALGLELLTIRDSDRYDFGLQLVSCGVGEGKYEGSREEW